MPARLPNRYLAAMLLSLSIVMSRPARAADASARFEAIRATADGRYEDVLGALAEGPRDPELELLRARALAELGRLDEALTVLPAPPEDWPAGVARDVLTLRSAWAAALGRCDELTLELHSKVERTRLEAECAFAAGNYARVKELLAAAKTDDERMLHVRSLIALGEAAAAAPLARALYVDAPERSDLGVLAPLLADGRGRIELSVAEHLARAEAWLEARRPEDALRELERLKVRGAHALEAKLFHLRGEALFRTRKDYAEAAKAFARAAKLAGDTEAYDAFHAVRALSRAGEDGAAIRGYRAFAKRYLKSNLVADALYLSAWLSARMHKRSANAELARFVESGAAKGAPGLRRDALWTLAWLGLRRKDTKDARLWLETYARAVDKPLDKARASYWLGRAALLDADEERAAAHFTAALGEDPLGYYAQLAAARLKALDRPVPLPWTAGAGAASRPLLAAPAEVTFYARLGLHDDAARAAEPWVSGIKDRTERLSALLTTGNVTRSFAAAEPLMSEIVASEPRGPRRWLWEALLPRPYRELVEGAAAKHGLDPDQVYGHMQVESRYKPRAVSGADALGLLQLLPSTAIAVAKGEQLPSTRSDVLKPAVNIQLGVAYLAGLVRTYDGQLPLAIAAYNAGTQRVDSWLGAKRHELDEWVEEIPVAQTQNYVRRVLSSWGRYQALEHPDDPWLSLPVYVGQAE